MKDSKRRWEDRLDRILDSRLAKQIWKYNPTGHGSVDKQNEIAGAYLKRYRQRLIEVVTLKYRVRKSDIVRELNK